MITVPATGNVTAFSDIKLKENVELIAGALDKVEELRGVTYNRVDLDGKPKHVGLIAQDVEAVVPEAVAEVDGTKTVAYGNLVGLLVEAVKELRAEVKELREGN